MKFKIFIYLNIFSLIILSSIFIANIFLQKNEIENIIFEKALIVQQEKETKFNKYTQDISKLLFIINQNNYFKKFVKNKENRKLIEHLFLNYSMLNKSIFQLRFLNKQGKEVVRVDQGEKNHIVKKENLQNKKNRYYFKEIYQLEENEIWLSNIDLNVEHGKIEYPHKPTLRIGLPAFVYGKKEGILIINLNVSEFLKNFQQNSFFEISIIDEEKNILVTPNNKYNWSKYLKLSNNISDIYPSLHVKNFNVIKSDLFIKKLNIQSREQLYTIFKPKKIDTYSILVERIKPTNYIVLTIFLIIFPLNYIISIIVDKYIKRTKKHNLFYEYDNLNTIYNCEFLNNSLIRELAILEENKKTETSIMLLRIDNYELLTDKLGVETYEDIFKETSIQISKELQACDTLARLNKEDFLIVLKSKNQNLASIYSEEIVQKLQLINIKSLHITYSSAVTQLKIDDTKETLLGRVFDLLKTVN